MSASLKLYSCSDMTKLEVGQLSPEYLTLRNSFRTLIFLLQCVIKQDFFHVAHFFQEFISYPERVYLFSLYVDDVEKSRRIADHLTDTVYIDPSFYHVFIKEILDNVPMVATIVKLMKEQLLTLQAILATKPRKLRKDYNSCLIH